MVSKEPSIFWRGDGFYKLNTRPPTPPQKYQYYQLLLYIHVQINSFAEIATR